MSKVKGRYVATVILNVECDDEIMLPLPFDEMNECLKNGTLTRKLKELIEHEYCNGNVMKLTVEQQYADLYMVGENE